MNGNADHPAGHVPADPSSAGDHSQWNRWRGALDRARDQACDALDALEGCNKQEAQAARHFLCNSLSYIALALLCFPKEGQRSSEGVGQENGEAAPQVSGDQT